MKKVLNYEKTFLLLSDAAVKYGIDLVVKDPVDFVKRSLDVSHVSAWKYLNELERRGLIAFDYDSVRISSARLLKTEFSKPLHETDNMTRVLTTLWKYRRGSLSDPKKQVVHSGFFNNIQSDADVSYNELYRSLKRFLENGWIELVYSEITKKPRIVYVIIKDEFPTHLVQ